MNDDSENETLSTPEKKRIYIQHWLENNPCVPGGSAEEPTPQVSPQDTEKIKNEFSSPQSPSLNFKDPAPALQPISPVFGKKRAPSSPIIGHGRRKRIKAARKLNSKLNLTPLLEASKSKASVGKDGFDISSNISSVSKETEILDCDSVSGIPSKILSKSAIKDSSTTDIKKKFSSKTSEASERIKSQVIESVSSDDKSPQKIDIHVAESPSDSDKTVSDLIEELPTQLDVQSSSPESRIPTSPQISNAPSESSKLANNLPESETTTTLNHSNNQLMRTGSPIDIIDSIGTSESRADVTKTCYILPHNVEKSKRKRNPKKGSLLETLIVALAKERSNVNLLRHELRKRMNDFSEKPFFLLQVVENQLVINESQFIKCRLVEDSMDLLKDLFTNRTNRFVTVINVPDVSGTINVNCKPLLKVYEPWSVIDPNQVMISITRFIAVPPLENNLEQIQKVQEHRNSDLIKEFNCPCLDEKAISVSCQKKFCDGSNNVIGIVFNDNM